MRKSFQFLFLNAKLNWFILNRGDNLEQQLYMFRWKETPQFSKHKAEVRIEESDTSILYNHGGESISSN